MHCFAQHGIFEHIFQCTTVLDKMYLGSDEFLTEICKFEIDI